MIINSEQAVSVLRQRVREAYRCDEDALVRQLAQAATLEPPAAAAVAAEAAALVHAVRAARSRGGVDALLHEYDLSSREGVVLMCLAEALMRVPDAETADRLIGDKLAGGDWAAHLGHSESLFVNASTWGLLLGGRMLKPRERGQGDLGDVLVGLLRRSGEPVIRRAVRQAMRLLGQQFVMGRNIEEALRRAATVEATGFTHSYDMLGEAARSADDARRYLEAYRDAIRAIGRVGRGSDMRDAPGISVKLSALHPRYAFAQREAMLPAMIERLAELASEARHAGIGLCVDAEEANRLDLSLEVIEAVAGMAELRDWDGFGLAIQAYQKRCHSLIDWLAAMARGQRRPLMVRLVKGAYWDSEIKDSQQMGYPDYPVFTRKANTDVSYLACARKLLDAGDCLYPQFATHNAHSVAWVLHMAGGRRFEFQRLHGMGETLYADLVRERGVRCRVYAPVGSHEDLLPYLVRRLLENGANSSFVNRIHDERLPVETIVADPVTSVHGLASVRHPRIPLPEALYGEERRNARGIDLTDRTLLEPLATAMRAAAECVWRAAPLIAGRAPALGKTRLVHDPADRRRVVGEVVWASAAQADEAMATARQAAPAWDATPVAERAACARRMADLLESNLAELLALCVREAGKTLPDALAEVREAVDFCRYYALRAEQAFAGAQRLPGPTGERNTLRLHGRGVFVCISPWNFPLAIFCGQVVAALVAGNTVIAKPAEQTCLIAQRAVALLHQAGVPGDVLHLLPGDGAIGARLVAHPATDGVAFTGSLETARLINRTLAERPGAIVPLIAETGGQNAMIADSTALPEQLVVDVIESTFQSAGQRCSALRVLYLQEDIADRVLSMLAGAMAELVVGDPAWLATDIGPVIDVEARTALLAHIESLRTSGFRLLGESRLDPSASEHGYFVAPVAFEIPGINALDREHFGPVLHVVRYSAKRLDAVIDAINASGYGLTLGVHTRMESVAEYIAARVRVGNCYVNRNQIGAVVGVQPFGGEGLSGTGPKAGGPHYLHRFAVERVVSVDTTAAGGNASLFAMEDDA
jgi:RHH-type transcriptional regulator, proline utilization regulon repressor / proline dehydrogenase / delta 1-pyrroline-5-carboxylate dehydrogenase